MPYLRTHLRHHVNWLLHAWSPGRDRTPRTPVQSCPDATLARPSPQVADLLAWRWARDPRQAIADHLRVARVANCEPSQILIVEGVYEAIDLAMRLLVDPHDTVWVE